MNRMKELRKELNISMKEAATGLKIPYTTYVNYEKCLREPNSEMLLKISSFFGVSVDYLLGRDVPRGIMHSNNSTKDTPSTRSSHKTSSKTLVGRNIKHHRTKHNLTEEQLGSFCDIDSSTIHLYENGEAIPDSESLRKIAAALSTTPQILTGENSDYKFKVAPPIDSAQLELMRKYFAMLNDTGMEEALKRIQELTEIPRYQNENISEKNQMRSKK